MLKGDYGVSGDGLMLHDRGGACISINFPDGSFPAYTPYDQANDHALRTNRSELYEDWDAVPLVHNAAVFSNLYHSNYYHYSFETVQKFRLLRDFDVQTVILPHVALDMPFKLDLVRRAMGDRVLQLTSHAVRVRDPVIVQTYQSPDGLAWLRGLYEPNAAPDGRRYYIRRPPTTNRLGNNIAETPDFLQVLEAHSFSIVDFGTGENSIQDQIGMLDGASVILTAHGAGLTNLAYLRAPLCVIEVFGPAVLSTSFMRISTALGFDHHAIISNDLDEAGDILVDCDTVEALLIG
jgi:capsular polysaccharide biosynthesis protein